MTRRPPPGGGAVSRAPSDRPAVGFLPNASALLASRVVIAGLGWTGTVLIVRALSTDDFGRFTFVFSLLGVMSIVTDMGIGRLALSGLMRGDETDRARFAGSYVLLRCLLGLVGYGVAVGFVALAGYDAAVVRATAVAGLVVVVATPAQAYETLFQAARRMHGIAVLEAVGRVAQLGLTAAVAAAGGSLLLFTVPAVLAELVVLVCVAPLAHRLVAIRYVVDVRGWWRLLREAAYLSVGGALTTLYYRVDLVMLSKMEDFTVVGEYGVAFKFVDLAHFVSAAVTVAILPPLVAAWPDRIEEFRNTVRRAATTLAWVGGAIVVEFALFAEALVRLLYGEAYAVAADAARVLVASQCLTYFSNLALMALIAADRQRRYPLIALVGLLMNVVLNLVLIPGYSYEGAACATLITDATVVVWMCHELRRVPGLRPLPRPPVLRLLAVGAVALVSGWMLRDLVVWPLAVVLVAGLYVGATVVLRAVGPGGVAALRE